MRDHSGEAVSEMIERVAISLCTTSTGWPWTECPSYLKDRYRQSAVGAIMAMREPTGGQLVAAHDAWDEAGTRDLASVAYQAMIDAALAERTA